MTFVIDTLVKLNEAIESNYTNIIVTNYDKITFDTFCDKYKSFAKLNSLEIKHDEILQLSHIEDILLYFVEKELEHLTIHAQTLEETEVILKDLDFYSNLETLDITAENYVGPNGHQDKKDFQDKIQEIIKKNRKMRNFFRRNLSQELNDLQITDDLLPENMNSEQVKYLWELGKQHDEYVCYKRRDKSLSDNVEYEKLISLSHGWCLSNILSTDDVEKLQVIHKYLRLDLNVKYLHAVNESEGSSRLIDWSTRDLGRLKIAEWLIAKNAKATRDFDQELFLMPSYSAGRYNTLGFPLGNLLDPNSGSVNTELVEKLKTRFIKQDAIAYDALAWFVFYENIEMFEKICAKYNDSFRTISKARYNTRSAVSNKNHRSIDYNKSITEGQFEGFSLFQLIIYYSGTPLLIKSISNLDVNSLRKIAQCVFPSKNNFEFSGWTILEVVIFKGLLNECMAFIGDLKSSEFSLKNNKYNILELLFYGLLLSLDSSFTSPDVMNRKAYNNILNYLIDKKWVQSDSVSNLLLKPDKDSTFGPVPFLHFCIMKHCYKLFSSHIKITDDLLKMRISYHENNISFCIKNANALQIAIVAQCRYDKSFKTINTIKSLYDDYKKHHLLEPALLENLSIFNKKQNIIHYLVGMYDHYELYECVLAWPESPVNVPYPDTHSEYPGWLPIHVAILKAYTLTDGKLSCLIKRNDLDLSKPFPVNDKYNISGYYILSALFYTGYPEKNNRVFSRAPIECAEKILEHMKNGNMDKTTMKTILNQALAVATIHSSSESSIKLLLEHGANPYQNLKEGYRIIDVAYENGIFSSFISFVEESFVPSVASQAPKLITNNRVSELSKYSGESHHIHENIYAVASLVRIKNSEHVFLVVEQIKKGLSHIDFIDFVVDVKRVGYGKVRHNPKNSGLHEPLIGLMENDDMMSIEPATELFAVQWQLPVEQCQRLFHSVEEDKKKELRYAMAGNGFFAKSSGLGDNCYTWARKKLIATDDPNIRKGLKPTWDERLGSWPRFKMTKSKKELLWEVCPSLFSCRNLSVGAVILTAGVSIPYMLTSSPEKVVETIGSTIFN